MTHLVELDRFVLKEMPSLTDEHLILDIGCGRGHWGYLIRNLHYKSQPLLIGIDITRVYLKFTKKMRIYDDLILCDATLLPFTNTEFDLVIAIEIIEHLPKRRGMELLSEMERVCDGRIIITTPNGYWRHDPSGGIEEAEAHVSQWGLKDFKSRGYRVKGIGFRAIKGYHGNPYLWAFFFYVFTPLSYLLPSLGEFLIAAKEVKCSKSGI